MQTPHIVHEDLTHCLAQLGMTPVGFLQFMDPEGDAIDLRDCSGDDLERIATLCQFMQETVETGKQTSAPTSLEVVPILSRVDYEAIERQAHELRNEELQHLTHVGAEKFAELMKVLGKKALTLGGFVSDSLRPLFSWNPGNF